MKVDIKTPDEIDQMRAACRMTAQARDAVAAAVQPGVTTADLDKVARTVIGDLGGKPSFLNYCGYPAAVCVSINEEVIHGIPGERVILPGDVVSIDIGAYFNGFHGDSARTVMVGVSDLAVIKLVETTERALAAGLAVGRAGCHLGDISSAIQKVAEEAGFSVVRDYVGHGVGRHIHEDPQVPNFGKAGHGIVLQEGMTLAIEPMVNLGRAAVEVLYDDWTVVTRDGKPSAHFEHTVAVHEEGLEILTLAS